MAGPPAQGAYLTGQRRPAERARPAQRARSEEGDRHEPTYQTFANQLKTGHTRPSIPAYTQISLALATEINAALNGTVSPAQALAKAAAEGNQAIASDGSGS